MGCKYKVGDKVLIKPCDYLRGHYLIDEYDEMAENWGGKVMTITACHDNGYDEESIYYNMLEDSSAWCWYEALIEGPATTIDISTDDLLDFIGT